MAVALRASIKLPVRIMWRMLFPFSRAAVLPVTITKSRQSSSCAASQRKIE
jgi:hypothetical protein